MSSFSQSLGCLQSGVQSNQFAQELVRLIMDGKRILDGSPLPLRCIHCRSQFFFFSKSPNWALPNIVLTESVSMKRALIIQEWIFYILRFEVVSSLDEMAKIPWNFSPVFS